MNTPKVLGAVLIAAAFLQICASRLAASGGNNSYITVGKTELFDQTSASAVVADPDSPFDFSASSPVAMSITPPGGSSITLTQSQGSSKYQYDQHYGTLAALTAAFPDGSYTLSVSGTPNFSISLAGDLYPNTPQVTSGTWNSSGQLVLDSTQSNTLTFNSFTGYGTSGVISHIELDINSPDNSTVSLTQAYLTPTNTAPFTSYVIPAGTLHPGSYYVCDLNFDTASADNATAVSGDTAVTLYSADVDFIIVTSGTPSGAPTITQQPTSQTAPLGYNVTFNVGFNGSNNTYVQWYQNGLPINQNNGSSSLTLNNITNSDAASYFAIVANQNGPYVQTNTVALTIGTSTSSSPSFLTQPVSQTISNGSTVVFNANASGSPTPSYQWYYNGSPLSGGNGVSGVTGPTLVINGATFANAGSYDCVVSNSSGSITSNTATLTAATTSNPGRLINISARAQVGTGANILIAGFVVGGAGTTGQESLLLRGSGPALIPYGVSGTLPDPQLQLYSGSAVLATNNGWGGTTQISSAAAAVGAAPWSNPSSHDSALLESLDGAYTAQISGQSGDTGVALAEVYDDTPAGTYAPTTPRLINISARVQVGTGGNILIAGFVIGGSTSRSVLIRASGPALIPYGVTGTLPDPELQLYSGSTLLGSNTGWGGSSEIVNAAATLGAATWTNPSSNDSAILVTLPPGAYTAQVSGASGDTGVALVEVYEYP